MACWPFRCLLPRGDPGRAGAVLRAKQGHGVGYLGRAHDPKAAAKRGVVMLGLRSNQSGHFQGSTEIEARDQRGRLRGRRCRPFGLERRLPDTRQRLAGRQIVDFGRIARDESRRGKSCRPFADDAAPPKIVGLDTRHPMYVDAPPLWEVAVIARVLLPVGC